MNQTVASPARRRLGALDWCLIVAAVLCIAGACWRLNVFRFFVPKAEPALSDYLVSFRVADIRSTSGELFADGTVFYLDGSGRTFGSVSGSVATTPAEMYVEDEDGKCVLLYYAEDGDDSRIDVSGTFLVKACISEDKSLWMLNGDTYLAPNLSVTLYSGELLVTVLITDVTPA